MISETVACPYVDLSLQHKKIKEELITAISDVIDCGQFILGPQVAEFERIFSAMCGTKDAIALNSGTDALILCLKGLDIGPGSEVITVPNSFVASASCIEIVGAKTVFVDVNHDYNLDPRELKKVLSPRTKAIIPVHLTGRPADMFPIMAFAKEHGLHVIEDCAQAVQAEYHDQQVGTFGSAGCFSLHPLKTLNACGDGGIVTTNSPDLAQKLRLYRNLGLQTRENCVDWCSNSRLDTMQAAILLVKMKYLSSWTAARRRNAQLYEKLLKGVKGITLPIDKHYEKSVYHTYVIVAERRDELKKNLAAKGIATAIHYPIPIHKQTVAKAYSHLKFPVTEYLADRILSLPIHQDLEPQQIYAVAEAIQNFYQ